MAFSWPMNHTRPCIILFSVKTLIRVYEKSQATHRWAMRRPVPPLKLALTSQGVGSTGWWPPVKSTSGTSGLLLVLPGSAICHWDINSILTIVSSVPQVQNAETMEFHEHETHTHPPTFSKATKDFGCPKACDILKQPDLQKAEY